MNPENHKKTQPTSSETTQNCKIDSRIYKMMYIVLVYTHIDIYTYTYTNIHIYTYTSIYTHTH